MSVLPKLLYLFQNIPLPVLVGLFLKLKKIITNFIWQNRRHRLRLILLYLPFDSGDLKAPNFQWYYWAAQLRMMMYYCSSDPPPAWVCMESFLLNSELPLSAYLYSAPVKTLKRRIGNPIISNMVNVWHKVHDVLGVGKTVSRFSPIQGNKHFKPGMIDAGFQTWTRSGLNKIEDLLCDFVMMSFEQPRVKFNLPKTHFF